MIAAAVGETTPEGWEGILDAGERILWQGRPDPTWHLTAKGIAATVFGTFFAGFALVWMTMAATGGGFFWTFGLLHFGAGVSVNFGGLYGPTWRRRHTWYTLTDKRAFVATDIPFRGRKLDTYPLGASTPLSLSDGTLGTVTFASKTTHNRKSTATREIGFERLSDAPTVYRLMRDVQMADSSKDPT